MQRSWVTFPTCITKKIGTHNRQTTHTQSDMLRWVHHLSMVCNVKSKLNSGLHVSLWFVKPRVQPYTPDQHGRRSRSKCRTMVLGSLTSQDYLPFTGGLCNTSIGCNARSLTLDLLVCFSKWIQNPHFL